MHCTALHYTTLRYATLRYTTLNYATHYTTLLYSTLLYTTYRYNKYKYKQSTRDLTSTSTSTVQEAACGETVSKQREDMAGTRRNAPDPTVCPATGLPHNLVKDNEEFDVETVPGSKKFMNIRWSLCQDCAAASVQSFSPHQLWAASSQRHVQYLSELCAQFRSSRDVWPTQRLRLTGH
eukprot:g64766.t1